MQPTPSAARRAGTVFSRRNGCAAALAAALALAGCSRGLDQKIDAKDRASYDASVQSIQKSMDDGEQAQFAAALREIEWGAAQPSADALAPTRGPRVAWVSDEAFERAALRAVDGKTGRQIVADAQGRAQARQRGLGAQMDAEIDRLQKDRDERQNKQSILDQIAIQGGQWAWDDSLGYGRLLLKMTIANGTNASLSAVDLAPGAPALQEAGPRAEADNASGARDAARPWRVELAPPLPAGQSRTLSLALNPFASPQILSAAQQSQIQARKSQPQALRALNALAANGVKLAPDFTAADQARLAQLTAERDRQKNLGEDLAKATDSK